MKKTVSLTDVPNRYQDRIPPWMLRGECNRFSYLAWYVDSYDETPAPEVAEVCARCPVRGSCLQWALDRPDETDGAVYGGLTPVQRRRLNAEKTRVVCPGCTSPEIIETYPGEVCLACGLSWRL